MWISRFYDSETFDTTHGGRGAAGNHISQGGASDESHSQLGLSQGAAVEAVTRTEQQGDL